MSRHNAYMVAVKSAEWMVLADAVGALEQAVICECEMIAGRIHNVVNAAGKPMEATRYALWWATRLKLDDPARHQQPSDSFVIGGGP